MRIVLVGRAKDRDRVRSDFLDAGFEIVREAGDRSDADATLDGVDAIVEATSKTSVAGAKAPACVLRMPEPLTAREKDVLGLLAEGLSNKSIGHALGISDQTVKFHVAAISGKLGAANRTEAVRLAVRRGLITL